jgi:thioredoxin-like negative regulator of GroEL
VDGLEEQYGDRLAVKRVNADVGDGPAIMRNYRIPGHPTILIFDQKGTETDRLVGPQPVETVTEAVQAVLAKAG